MSSLFVEDPEYRAWEDWLEFHRSQSTEEGTGGELRTHEYGQYEDCQSPVSPLQSRDIPPDSAVLCDSAKNPTTPESCQSTVVPQSMDSFGSSRHASSSGHTNADESVACRGRQLGMELRAGGERQTNSGKNRRAQQSFDPYKRRGDYSRWADEKMSSRVPTKTAEPPRRTSWEQQYTPIEGYAAHVETPSEHLDPHCDEPDPSLRDWVDNFLEYV